MLSVHGRKPAAVVVEPIAKAFLKLGLTPNVVTVVGTIVTIAISVILIPTGHLFFAAVLSGLFAAFDMLDGTMARLPDLIEFAKEHNLKIGTIADLSITAASMKASSNG